MKLSPDRIQEIRGAWTGQRILVLGDLMLDRYLWGRVDRISPEAPVPVVDVESESLRLGGAANVARNVLSLGARPVLLGVVGDDPDGGKVRESLSEAAVDASALVVDPGRPTTVKTRIVARSQHVVRADRESREEIRGGTEAAVLRGVEAGLEDAAAVVVSDYGKGVVTADLLGRLLVLASERGVPVCVDPKDTHFFSYRGVAVLTPNQYEAAEVLGYKLRDEDAVERAGREILERLGAACVLITRGERGMSLFERGTRIDLPAVARRVFDVTGAGDTVVGVYAVALAGGAVAREAALIANHAAGQVVAEVGTAIPDPDLLCRAVSG